MPTLLHLPLSSYRHYLMSGSRYHRIIIMSGASIITNMVTMRHEGKCRQLTMCDNDI